jgi:predicted SAM-dependent methyltransferase
MIRDFVRTRTSLGVKVAAHTLLAEYRIQRLHRSGVSKARRFVGQKQLKLNLGCGPNVKEGWVNIDLSRWADLHLDLREDLPFADESVALIYSEHFFEHLAYPDEVRHLLLESFRVLQPGGVFSVGVPDLEPQLVEYVRETTDSNGLQPEDFARKRKARGEEEQNLWIPRWVFTTHLHIINWYFRQNNEHKYAYDFQTLATVLAEAGFDEIERRPFNPELDTEKRRAETLYVDAHKPA